MFKSDQTQMKRGLVNQKINQKKIYELKHRYLENTEQRIRDVWDMV